MSLWYCSAQRSTGLGWMTKFDRAFQLIPLPFPFKVRQCAALIIHLFMSWCFVVCGHMPRSPCHESSWNTQAWKAPYVGSFWSRGRIMYGFYWKQSKDTKVSWIKGQTSHQVQTWIPLKCVFSPPIEEAGDMGKALNTLWDWCPMKARAKLFCDSAKTSELKNRNNYCKGLTTVVISQSISFSVTLLSCFDS